MRHMLLAVASCLALICLTGCSNTETSVKKTESVQTPSGKTTVTTEQKVEKSGENPPPTK